MKEIKKQDMIAYLQAGLTRWKEEEKRFPDDERTWKHLDRLIYQKEMVEALIGEPVNLQKDGKVTVGWM